MSNSGLAYFPLDVHLDSKFELIEAEFGLKGFGIVVKLLQKIYGGEGYYLEWTNEVGLLFSRHVGEGYELVSEIVAASIRRGIFDQKLFDKYGVLTSSGIQKRYLEALRRRQKVEVKKQYLLISDIQKYKNVYILAENADISSENADIFKESKVKKSKEKKSKTTTITGVVGVVRLFESIKGMPLTGYECEKLKDMVGYYSAEWVNDALKVMADAGKVKLNYAEGILNNWQANGKGTKPACQKQAAEREKRFAEWHKKMEAEGYE